MAEIKRTFSASKMNKDIDERLVPPGEYRDALNVEVNTSEESNVGTVQTILGNTALTSIFPANSMCVGSIADSKTDKIYWMVAGATSGVTSESFALHIKKDYIVEYDVQLASTKYVLVDIYEVQTTMTNDGHGSNVGTFGVTEADHLHIIDGGTATANITGVRIGMNITGTFTNNSGAVFIAPNGNSIANGATYDVSVNDNVTVLDIQKDTGTPSDWRIYTSKTIHHEQGDVVVFKSERLLNFDSSRLITGINILDGMLFWTDDYSEPKKINIERSIAGTGGNIRLNGAPITGYQNFTANNSTAKIIFSGDTDTFHTRLVSSKDGVNLEVMTNRLNQKAVWLEEEHITVLRKAPHTPPYLEMSDTGTQRTDDNGNVNNTDTFVTENFSSNGVLYAVEDGPFSITFNAAVDFRVGDIILFTSNTGLSIPAFTDDLAEVRIVITDVPSGPLPFTGPFEYKILSNAQNGTVPQNFLVKLDKAKPIFELKFPRFAYRYKYKDGEHSTFSPFSEPAFLPGVYDYAPKNGYNLGMTNQLRSLKITDYIVEDSAKGQDVIEVDILLKHEDSPNIYTVATIKPTNDHPEWPDKAIYPYTRGEYELESELIHAAVPSNQLLRPWDNVPLKAKAQDITANRLVYGNYVQNYDVSNSASIDVGIESTLGDFVNNVQGAELIPSKSVKSLRTYQLGVVYRDKYGRETPVITGNAVDSVVKVTPLEAQRFNKITARLKSPAPEWADSYKFFVKQTSNEYYSLAMDRWYNAEDDNVWISFPSAERNKINIHKTDRETDNTVLILKKQHTTDLAITEEMRYKVIDIKDEAPEFIKRNTKILGTLTNTPSTQSINQTTAGFPFADTVSFQCNTDDFNNEFLNTENITGGVQDLGVREAMHNGFLYVRFGSGTSYSNYYKVSSMTPMIGSDLKVTIDGKFSGDVVFLAPDGTTSTIVSGVFLELATKIPENKPEFDGKFFVKILGDINIKQNITAFANDSEQWAVVNAMNSYYIHYEKAVGAAPAAGLTHDPTPTTGLINSVNLGGNATYRQYPKGLTAGFNTSGNYPTGSGWSNNTKQAVAIWWVAWGFGWFIDSAITANEDAEDSYPGVTMNEISNNNGNFVYTDIENGTHGVFNANANGGQYDGNTGISGNGTGLSLSWSGIGGETNTFKNNENPEDFNVGGTVNPGQGPIVGLLETVGTQFRFRQDPDNTVYTIEAVTVLENRYNYDAMQQPINGRNDAFRDGPNKRKTWKLVVQDRDGNGIGNKDGAGNSYDPTITDPNGRWTKASSSNPIGIEFVVPFAEEDDQLVTNNPAVWETEPKEDVGLDIYYEATSAIPLDLNFKTNEQFAKYGSTVENETTNFGTALTVVSWSDQTVTLSGTIPTVVTAGDTISFTAPDGGITRLEVKTTTAAATTTQIEFVNETHSQKVTLPYFNCYSFQNGVESNRIRDDYNEVYLRNGVKASTVLAKHYEEERRGAGLIHSGIYNSTSGTNELNQFRQAEPITKDLNPRHGSIQKLLNRNTDLIAITEDKCFKIMADKDALYNADGSSQLIASNKVLGQATPYAGDFGTTNPESFAQDNFRSYFVDRTRGKVCRLSRDGITPISSAGMHDWFADNLQVSTDTYKTTVDKIVGSFDAKKQLYNVTIEQKNSAIKGRSYESPADTYHTLSYSETAKGWVSFKSFYPESGLSINNDYYTFKGGEMWKHHTNETRGNFYGDQYYSDITVMFNDQPGSIKSFNTINYEGSQAKITQHGLSSKYTNPVTGVLSTVVGDVTDANGGNVSQQDGEYYNLNAETGWYVDSFETNEQSATVHEFIEKEGKWFNNIRGVATKHLNDSADLSVTFTNLDQQEFSVQGIGVAETITSDEVTNNQYKFKVTNNTSTSYDPDTERDGNTDGDPDGIWDSSAD